MKKRYRFNDEGNRILYHLSNKDISYISRLYKSLDKDHIRKDFFVSMSYFMKSYASFMPNDRILNLCTVLETSLLADNAKSELAYRLQMRASFVIKRNIMQEIKHLYNIRSCIIHSGFVSSSELKKAIRCIKVKTNNQLINDIFIDYAFHCEDIVRSIYKRIIVLYNRKKYKTVGDLAAQIDLMIVAQFS